MSALTLERETIEKTFPTGRRGYETGAVDAHLAAVATEVGQLQQELDRAARAAVEAVGPRRGSSLSATASEQLQVIVQAAEHSAAEIERAAAEESTRVRGDADAEARRVRDEAVARSQDHVERVIAVTSAMLERVGAMEDELGALFESVRTGTTRLTTELALLHEHLDDLHGPASATGAEPGGPAGQETAGVFPDPPHGGVGAHTDASDGPGAVEAAEAEQAVEAPEAERAVEAPEVEQAVEAAPAAVELVAPAEIRAAPPTVPVPPRPPRRTGGADVEGARLTALSMALDGQTREETAAFLGEHFDLADRDGLLDEVYASVTG